MKSLTKYFTYLNGYTEVFNEIYFDWSLLSPPTINNDYLLLGMKGLFFPEDEKLNERIINSP